MSLIQGKYHIDWKDLPDHKREARRLTLEAMIRKVAVGVDNRPLITLLTTGDVRRAEDVQDLCASSLEGSWHVLSEEWQGRERDYFICKGIYIDEHAAAVIIAARDLGDPDEEEPEVEDLWFDLGEFKAMGLLARGV